MTKQQVQAVTLAALAEWAASSTKESFKNWITTMKNGGRYWGSEEDLEEAPQ